MKFSQRELLLAWFVGIAVLFALTYWFVQPRLQSWNELRDYQTAATKQIAYAQRLVRQRDHWLARMESLKSNVDFYPEGRDVSADYLRLLEKLSKETDLTLVKRNAQKEKSFGDLLELVIDCTWEGSLEALINFIYKIEEQTAIMDIDDLTISMISGKEDQLKGNFSIICLYSRGSQASAAETGSDVPAAEAVNPAAGEVDRGK